MATGEGTRRSVQTIGDDAVAEATGRGRGEWFSLLDAAGASGWSHREIAAWLAAEHGVDGWWAQSVTVAYEQERGMRAPGQRADGRFEVSSTKSVAGDLEGVFALVADAEHRARWLDPGLAEAGAGERSEVLGATPTSSVRLVWPVGALGAPAHRPGRVIVGLYQARDDDGTPRGKVRVGVQHGGLESTDLAERLRAFWKDRLADLARLADETTGPGAPGA
ncbi:hypothetical protein GCM10009809_17620 [Isoptericola hypogeus]|uniref:DUF4287 domain-containing protein n=1 Tax=Isoptericola hypogeus TaxID=300179 RepID=A0ABN2JCG2_9MICO